MKFNFINAITFISLFQCILLSVVYFLKGKTNKSNYQFSILFFIYSLQILFSLSVNYYSYLQFTEYIKIFRSMYLTALLIAPLLYFIIYQYYEGKQMLFRRILLHFIPFILLEGILIFGLVQDKVLINLNFTRFIIITQSVFYIVISFRFLHKHNVKVRGIFKGHIEKFEDLLKLLLICYVVLWIINVQIFGIVKFYTFANWCAYVSSLYALVMFVFITLLLTIHMLRPGINHIKYRKDSLNESEAKNILDRVTEYIYDRENYKNENLSLHIISSELNISAKQISKVINKSLQMNLNEYINYYRIKKAQILLKNNKDRKLTTSEILYEVGFGSKSAFYTAFKKITGITPSEFRKKVS